MTSRTAFAATLATLKLGKRAAAALLAIYDETHAAIAEKDARLEEARRMLAEQRTFVFDLLTVWQGYAEKQWATAEGTKRLVLADRAQTMLDVKNALMHPKTITWPEGHPRVPR